VGRQLIHYKSPVSSSARPAGSGRRVDSPQVLAVKALRAIDRTEGFSNRILGDTLERSAGLSPGARGLVTALVYGVLRHRIRLDAHIDARARDAKGLGSVPRMLLRVGAYEILELGRPAGNAIGHAVSAARSFDPSRTLSGLVHGMLSAIAEGGGELDAKLAAAAPLDALERRYSIPRWLAGRWLGTLGAERALRRAALLAEVPSVDLRVDLSRIDAAHAEARLLEERPTAVIERVADMPQALRVRGGGDLFFGALHDEGLVSVQGLAAQQPAIVLAPQPGWRVLDACAGLGVKTLQLAELMDRRGMLVAADREQGKLDEQLRLGERGRLVGDGLALRTIAADLAEPCAELEALAPFDGVLLDVPCTGLGNLARHPEIRWHRRYDDIAAAAAVQARLLARLWPLTRPGGRLVYAVCSAEPEEGPAIIRGALQDAPLELTAERTWTPEDDGTEGFYVAALARR
jgi:16S rRNA (cytosine967-C5)-methyltransferase